MRFLASCSVLYNFRILYNSTRFMSHNTQMIKLYWVHARELTKALIGNSTPGFGPCWIFTHESLMAKTLNYDLTKKKQLRNHFLCWVLGSLKLIGISVRKASMRHSTPNFGPCWIFMQVGFVAKTLNYDLLKR